MKKFTKWKSFDFGTETKVDDGQSTPNKQHQTDLFDTTKKNKPATNSAIKKPNFDFHKKVAPQSVADLAVHAKKVQEVEGWLKTVLANASERQRTQFLLITGPTGCGKAATIQVLCKSLNVAITEWVNPVDIDFDILKGPGQVSKFLTYFTEGKYSSLFSSGYEKKVFVIKDIPNAFVKNTAEFFTVLDDVFFKATHPVIFICTDSNSNEINLQRSLFPEEIQLKYSITHFSFNSCAATLLKKGLKRAQDIVQKYPDMFRMPSSNTIDAIVASSMGDIRCAMNQLYLACLKGHEDLPTTKSTSIKVGSKRKRNDQLLTVKYMVRDEALGLFHGLGRVLNPKRREEGHSWKLNCDVEKLVDEFSIQPSKFTSFLFENYLKYFGELEDVEKSAECLSLSTHLMENWDKHDVLVIGLWISVLGLMIFNEHKASKWNQIKGPRKLDKICLLDEKEPIHPTDRYFYNMITKSQKYHKFNCDL